MVGFAGRYSSYPQARCLHHRKEVHPASAYPLEKKAFHPLDEIRADTKVRPYKNSLTLALGPGGEGTRVVAECRIAQG